MTSKRKAREPLTRDEIAKLRAEVAAEIDHENPWHREWMRLTSRLLATVDDARDTNRLREASQRMVALFDGTMSMIDPSSEFAEAIDDLREASR